MLSAVGVDPRSSLVKALHVALGAALVVSSIALSLRTVRSWWASLAASVLVLWYVPFGTVAGLANCILLLLPGVRNTKANKCASGNSASDVS